MTEPLLPELPPEGPSYVERDVPICPICRQLVRRDLREPAAGRPHGPWMCDIHRQVTPVWERVEVPEGYDDES